MKNIYTSLDIGTDTIKVVVCELYRNKLNLLAASSKKSKGIKKGVITDVDEALSSVKEAFDEVEAILGVKIKKVIASVPSYFAEFTYVKGEVSIDSEDRVITGDHIVNVLQNAAKSKITPAKELVTILPIDFDIKDGLSGVKDPKGLVGEGLSTRAIMVTVPRKNVYSVVKLVESLGIEVVDISINGIGDYFVFKNKELDNKLGIVINVGYETTTVSLYNKGIIVKNAIIPLGGRNVDHDLAYIFNLNIKDAVRLKEKFALAHKLYAGVNDAYEVLNKDRESLKINQLEASEIIMSRLEEILLLAKKEISILTNREIQYIIVTGGTSSMTHFNYIASDIFGKDVIIGNVRLLGIRNNKYSSAVGNIIYFINKLKLRGIEYSMFSKNDVEDISQVRKNLINVSGDSMLSKVFGYFWND